MKKNEVLYNPFEAVENSITSDPDFDTAKNMVEASVVSLGNRARLKKVIKKAQSGGNINIVTLGGSITEGSGKSDGEYYGDLLDIWFKDKFKTANINYTNAGRGTTTSLFGVARIERDILPLDADIIVVEYAVNDTILDEKIAAETFEGLLRKLLMLPSEPCVFVLYMCLSSLGSSMDIDLPISEYYDLPTASLARAIKYQLKADSASEDEEYIRQHFIFDGVHPDTPCYHKTCEFITYQIEKAISEIDEIDDDIPPLPEALVSERFMRSRILNSTSLTVSEITDEGWQLYNRDAPYTERGFVAIKPNASITFQFNCKILALVSRKSLNPQIGSVIVKVDGNDPIEIDGYFHEGWGTHNNYRIIIDDSIEKHHIVTVTFSDKKNENARKKLISEGKNPNDASTKFILSEFIVS